MRDVKFRGRAELDTLIAGSDLYYNNEWVYGNLIITDDGVNIIQTWDRTKGVGYMHNTFAVVVPDTVGQYTGLKDKNGKEIYEGDIYHQGNKNIKYIVVWHDTGFIGKQIGSSSYAGLKYWKDKIEVLGNLCENPDLLK